MKINKDKRGALDLRKKKLVLYRKMNIKKRKERNNALRKHAKKLGGQWQYYEASGSDLTGGQ